MQWTMQHGLLIQSRLDNTLAQDEAWTCRRAMDLSLVQLDYILTSPKFSIEKSWCDFSIPIGLDHRCVHCQLKLLLPKPKKRNKILSLKNWRPNLDENNVASDFQSKILSLLAANCTANMEVLENMLVQAGIHHGTVLKFRMHFRPSTELKTLRHSRRHSQTQVARKTLSLQIRKLHRRELRLWRSRHLATLLKYVSCWKTLRENLPRPSGRRSAQQPPVDEFASMLEALFVGPPAQASNFPSMLDPPWTWADLMQAIKRLKINKASDDCGLTAELLKVAPDEYLIAMLDAFNFILRTGQIPASWKLTLFFFFFSLTPFCRNVAEKSAFHTDEWFQTHCEHSIILQGVRLYGSKPHRKCLGTGTAWRTTWFSSRKKNRRAFVNNKHPFGQGDRGWKDNLDCESGLVKSFRPCALASTVGSSTWPRCFRTLHMVTATHLWPTNWRGRRENGAGAGTLQSQPVWNRGAFWAQDFSVLHWSGLCVVGKMHPKGQELIWGMGCRISWNYVSLMIFYSLQILARKLRNFWTNWLLQLGALDWFSMLKKR